MGGRGVIGDKWSNRVLWLCAIGSAIGLWMVGVERQAQNRERMLRAMESGGDADSRGTFARMGKFACYVVIRGRKPGVYSTWDECKAQVNSYRDALYWGCHSEEEAIEALTTTCREKTPPIRDTDTVIRMLKRPSIVQEPPCSSVSLPPSSPSVASIDEWKIEKRLVRIFLFALITLVVVVIAVVVKLYLF